MTPWDDLLRVLAETPRENGTAALHQTAAWLHETLRGAGLEAELLAFTARPYALRLAGVVALAGGLAYLRAVRARRAGIALAVALAVPAILLAELSFQLPVLGWIGAQTEHHVRARISPEAAPAQRFILVAHYDSKTDVADHVERAPIELATPLVVALLPLGALALARWGDRRGVQRAVSALGVVAAAWGACLFVVLSAGAFLPERSPGALDDGGSCAVLVRLAEDLAAGPRPARTEVEILLVAAEEVGVQGSWAYASERFATPPDVPTFVVNLELVGASLELGYFGRERFVLTSHEPDARVVALLARVYQESTGRSLERAGLGGATDARSFLAHGVPAATLFSREPGVRYPRGLHSPADVRARLSEAALEDTVGYLAAVLRAADADPLPSAR